MAAILLLSAPAADEAACCIEAFARLLVAPCCPSPSATSPPQSTLACCSWPAPCPSRWRALATFLCSRRPPSCLLLARHIAVTWPRGPGTAPARFAPTRPPSLPRSSVAGYFILVAISFQADTHPLHCPHFPWRPLLLVSKPNPMHDHSAAAATHPPLRAPPPPQMGGLLRRPVSGVVSGHWTTCSGGEEAGKTNRMETR